MFVSLLTNYDTNMTDSLLSRYFSYGDIESLLYLSNWHTGSLYNPICHDKYIFHTYILLFHGWWIPCDIQDRHRRPIHRLWPTNWYIYGFLTSLCPYESLWTRMATLMSPLRFLQLYTRESMWRACDLVVLRSLLPTRTDTDNKVFQWTHIRPGRQFLRLGRPIVPIGVIQTLIDTIGPIHNPWFHRSHVRKWVPYEAIFAHRPMEGVYNIVSFDNDMIVRAIDSLTITPTNEDK